MAATTFGVTTDDLDARRIEYEDAPQADAAIADASAAVAAYLARFVNATDADGNALVDLASMTDDQAAAAKAVVLSIIRRLLSNPRGLAQESLGDYSYSLGGTATGSMRPTPTERRMLREAFRVAGARSIEMNAPLPLLPEYDDAIVLP